MREAFPVTWDDLSDAALTWEWDDEHMPQALTPLAGDWTCTLTEGFAYRAARAGLAVEIEYRVINGYAYVAERFLAPEAEVRERAKESRRAQAQILLEYWESKVFPFLMETYRWMRSVPIESAALPAVADAWDKYWDDLPRLWGLHYMTISAAYQALDDLAEVYGDVMGGAAPSEALRLVLGQFTVLHTVQRDLYQLAETVRGSPAAQLIVDDPRTALTALQEKDGGSAFAAALDTFLETHGHLGQDDLIDPSWQDDPSLVLAEIRKRLLEKPEDPEAHRQRLVAEADALVERVRAQLSDRSIERIRFEDALALARRVGWLTEGHNYWLDRMLQAHTRRFALRAGGRLAEAGVLAEAADVFFLHAGEVSDALRHPRDLRSLIADRKAEHARWSAIRPPKYLGTPPPSRATATSTPVGSPATIQVLRGISACIGIARGPARIVRSPGRFEQVQRGDVLVCPAADPSWVPLFSIIAGLVTDTGGALSHAAVVAREFGIPAVVGTGDATQRIRDGQMIEVDGTAGEVRLQ